LLPMPFGNYFYILQEKFEVNIKIEKCPAYHDERGDLIQFVTQQFLQKQSLPFGQVYLLTFNGKNVIRGNHYHNHSSEIFCVISGSVEMIFEEVVSKERRQKNFTADKNEFFRISIGKKIAHSIKSISDFAVMVSFSSTEFDLKEEDKIPYRLI
jgi:dTDP-4-dehydrorhamnose 3,5-epimerase-like enzyme